MQFERELRAIIYDQDTEYTTLIFDALSDELEKWQALFEGVLKDILATAKSAESPEDALWVLSDFMFVFDIESPVVRRLAEIAIKEMDTEKLPIKLALIDELTFYLDNPVLKNNLSIVNKLQQYLYDVNSQVRLKTYKGLKENNLLPSGFKPTFWDRLFSYF